MYQRCEQQVLQIAFVALLVAPTLAAGAEGDATNCASDPDVDCILTAAEADLPLIDGHRAFVTAVSEIAIAAAEAGQPKRMAGLLDQAQERALELEPADKASALHEIANALAVSGSAASAAALLDEAQALEALVEDAHKRADLGGKRIVLQARHGDLSGALRAALEMAQGDDNLAAYKARTLHELAPLQAQAGDFDAALETLAAITMSIAYYQAVARADVAAIAGGAGEHELAESQFSLAEEVARAQSDGYFIAGALRQIGDGRSRLGQTETAKTFFSDAADGARTANTVQEQARALSRVATSLADHGMFDDARGLVEDASSIADSEASEMLRAWAFYEIAGAAAFAGDFAGAAESLQQVAPAVEFSGVPVVSATQRDIAWGYARHGRLDAAIATAQSIGTPRERVQAYARVVRLMADPDMTALPRYL